MSYQEEDRGYCGKHRQRISLSDGCPDCDEASKPDCDTCKFCTYEYGTYGNAPSCLHGNALFMPCTDYEYDAYNN
jgi:hypothetical protein